MFSHDHHNFNQVQKAYQSFADLQGMVTGVLDNSERIRLETDDVVRAMNDFMNYKFQTTYNSRVLFNLKQGQVGIALQCYSIGLMQIHKMPTMMMQVEVSQAPDVTDYSEAILINRQEVEQLNEVIATHSKAKVDALMEMKNYRKGIHAIEWVSME